MNFEIPSLLIGAAMGAGLTLALHTLTGWLAGRRLHTPHIDLSHYTVPSADAYIALSDRALDIEDNHNQAMSVAEAIEAERQKRKMEG